jgi:hypothetical protein
MRRVIPMLAVLAMLALPAMVAAGPGPLLIPEVDLPSALTPAHDPSCIVPYSATNQPFIRIAELTPSSVMDDLHLTTTTDAALCAFTFSGRTLSATPIPVTINFRSGGAADPVPGGVTAGPFEVMILPVTTNYHVEVASGYVTPNAYFEVRWETDFVAGIRLATDGVAGTSHDLFYLDPPGEFTTGDGLFPPENFWVELFVSPPVPTQTSTWGAVKAIYR